MQGQFGNAAKRLQDDSPGPWRSWRKMSRHARAIKFIQTFCVVPKGHGSGKPVKLAGFQKSWLEEVLAPGVDSAAQQMPRGGGKSTFEAAIAT